VGRVGVLCQEVFYKQFRIFQDVGMVPDSYQAGGQYFSNRHWSMRQSDKQHLATNTIERSVRITDPNHNE